MADRKALLSLQFLKGGKNRSVRLEVLDDASGQVLALVNLDPAQFTKFMSSDNLEVRAEVAGVVPEVAGGWQLSRAIDDNRHAPGMGDFDRLWQRRRDHRALVRPRWRGVHHRRRSAGGLHGRSS